MENNKLDEGSKGSLETQMENKETTAPKKSGTSRRGFASMDQETQRAIASKGGRAAHARGTAHEWSSEEAREAGRRGGRMSHGGRGKDYRGSETAENKPSGAEIPSASASTTERAGYEGRGNEGSYEDPENKGSDRFEESRPFERDGFRRAS